MFGPLSPNHQKLVDLTKIYNELIVQCKCAPEEVFAEIVGASCPSKGSTTLMQVLMLAPTFQIAMKISDVINLVSRPGFCKVLGMSTGKAPASPPSVGITIPSLWKKSGLKMGVDLSKLTTVVITDFNLMKKEKEAIPFVLKGLPNLTCVFVFSAMYDDKLFSKVKLHLKNPHYFVLTDVVPSWRNVRVFNYATTEKEATLNHLLSNLPFSNMVIFADGDDQEIAKNVVQQKSIPSCVIVGRATPQQETFLRDMQKRTHSSHQTCVITDDWSLRGFELTGSQVHLSLGVSPIMDNEAFSNRLGRNPKNIDGIQLSLVIGTPQEMAKILPLISAQVTVTPFDFMGQASQLKEFYNNIVFTKNQSSQSSKPERGASTDPSGGSKTPPRSDSGKIPQKKNQLRDKDFTLKVPSPPLKRTSVAGNDPTANHIVSPSPGSKRASVAGNDPSQINNFAPFVGVKANSTREPVEEWEGLCPLTEAALVGTIPPLTGEDEDFFVWKELLYTAFADFMIKPGNNYDTRGWEVENLIIQAKLKQGSRAQKVLKSHIDQGVTNKTNLLGLLQNGLVSSPLESAPNSARSPAGGLSDVATKKFNIDDLVGQIISEVNETGTFGAPSPREHDQLFMHGSVTIQKLPDGQKIITPTPKGLNRLLDSEEWKTPYRYTRRAFVEQWRYEMAEAFSQIPDSSETTSCTWSQWATSRRSNLLFIASSEDLFRQEETRSDRAESDSSNERN